MAKKLLCIAALILTLVCVFASCDNTGSGILNQPENPTHTHAYGEWEIQKAATCTTVGSKDRYCPCGEKQTASISATGHSFGGWVTVKEATQTEKGRKERVCSCGEKETQEIDVIIVVTTVTANEWKNAFNLPNNFVFCIDETGSDSTGYEGFWIRGSLTVQNGTIYTSITEFYDGDEDTKQFHETGTINNFFDLGDYAGEWLWEFGSDLNSELDYGFSRFVYSETHGSYVARMEIDGQILCDVIFWFENKQITKIIISGQEGDMLLNCTYTFAYN